jgi:integrase
MASIKKRPDGQWRARYRDVAGREHAKHFGRRVDAQRWLDEVTAAVVTGQYVDPRAGRTTVREYAERWAAAQPWRTKTSTRVESALRVHIFPTFGDRALASVRPTEVQAWTKRLPLAPASAKAVYGVLRSLMRAAVEDRLLTSSPCTRVALGSVAPKVLTIPSAADVAALAAALPPRYAAVPYVAAGLGLRPGEVFGLQVSDVDFLRRSVTVARQLDEHRKLGPLKTESSYRTVPLPATVGDVLAAHLAGGLGHPDPDAHRHGHLDQMSNHQLGDNLLFTDAAGGPVLRNSFSKVWRAAVRMSPRGGALRLHDLRHTYASALIEAGESVKVVQARLGHASAMVTLDVYGHLWPDSDDRTRAAVDAFLAPTRQEGLTSRGQAGLT